MKANLQILSKLILAALSMTLVHCGSGSGGGGGGGSTSGTTCAANQVSTGAGCLATCGNNNGVAMVVYNNQCVPSTSVSSTNGIYGQSCGTNMITSQYGCLTQCGTQAVVYNGQCVPVGTNLGGGNAAICSQGCSNGQVSVGNTCLPQYSCGNCYGYANGYCYQGNYAHQYYQQ